MDRLVLKFIRGGPEPCPRGSAQSPSPCGSKPWLFFFFVLSSPFRGCRPRTVCREWVERVGGGLCVFSWRTNSARTDTCLLARSGTSFRVEEDSLHKHQEEGPASPGEPDSPSRCIRLWAGVRVSTWVWKLGFCFVYFLNSYSGVEHRSYKPDNASLLPASGRFTKQPPAFIRAYLNFYIS